MTCPICHAPSPTSPCEQCREELGIDSDADAVVFLNEYQHEGDA